MRDIYITSVHAVKSESIKRWVIFISKSKSMRRILMSPLRFPRLGLSMGIVRSVKFNIEKNSEKILAYLSEVTSHVKLFCEIMFSYTSSKTNVIRILKGCGG